MTEGGEAEQEMIDTLSDVGREELLRKLPAAAATALVSRSGVSWIVLSGMISVSEAKEETEGFVPGFLFMEYSGYIAVLITFTRPLPGYCTASASIAPSTSMDEVRPLLEKAGKLGLSLALEEL